MNAVDLTVVICPRCGAEVRSKTPWRYRCACGYSRRVTRFHGGESRPKSESKRVMLRMLKTVDELPPGVERPRTRAECIDGPRPCPWVSCRYHLYLDVTRKGSLKFNFPSREVEELEESCALDVADAGGAPRETVGAQLNLTSEAVRLIEERALHRLKPIAEDIER